MRAYRDASIRTKLTLILILVIGAAVLITGVILTWDDVNSAKAAVIEHLDGLADVVGSSSTAALSFGDRPGAEEVLQSLKLERNIAWAGLYDAKGKIFAHYRKEGGRQEEPEIPPKVGHAFTESGHIEVASTIQQDQQLLGTIVLRAQLDQVYAPVRHRIIVRAVVMLLALAFAVVCAARLQRVVSEPIVHLVRAIRDIAERGDYTVRVQRRGADELGVLYDGFNAMLAHIQARDSELERHRFHLEKLVQERTATLEAKTEELSRSNSELELFASVASHDLQEPLRMVSSYVELLAQRYQEQLDDKARRWIKFAIDGAGRMKQLINDLLEYSRVGTHGKPFEPIDCEVAFKQVTTNLQRAVADKGAVVSAGPLPTLVGDPTQINQLLQNLIGNAIKFCSTTQPEVRVEAVSEHGVWHFSVRDNGIGIDPQFAERIFVIFQRLHTREQYSGTGIGLAVCKKIVERHGGRIWVESQLGQGAVFHFTIPDRKDLAHGNKQAGATG